MEQTPVAVGNWGLMKRLGVALPEGVRKDGVLPWDQWMKDAKTIAFVALGGRLELALALCDRPKTDAAATSVQCEAGICAAGVGTGWWAGKQTEGPLGPRCCAVHAWGSQGGRQRQPGASPMAL